MPAVPWPTRRAEGMSGRPQKQALSSEVPRDGPELPVFGERCRLSFGAKERKPDSSSDV